MPKPVRRLYWCSNVFLSYINELKDRVPDIEALLASAKRGEIQIVTSVLSVAEVAFATSEQDSKALDSDVGSRIQTLWVLGSPIQLVEFHLLIAEGAQALRRLGVPASWTGLRSVDAMHLATAKHESVDGVHTYDEKLYRYAPEIGCPIGPPIADEPLLGL